MHFFIDHLKIGTQADEDRYGAVTLPDGTFSSTKYNVTSRFQLTNEAKAFACQESMMIVQQSSVDVSLVNVILKPTSGSIIPLDVKYYVYRGILKSSLINGSNILSKASTNNELIERIWKKSPTDTGAGTLGFDGNTFAGTDDVETVFDDSRADVRSILVTEGEWFGDFGKHYPNGNTTINYKIGFEIVLKTDRLNLDLNYVRGELYQVNVTGLAGFNERAKREQILYFIDPAAFFGAHFSKGVKYWTYSGTTKTTKSSIEKVNNVVVNNTYSLFVSPFSTKNRVYLDVRSEKGYSYNFYQNYRDPTNEHNIKLGQGTVAPVSQEYNTDEWPIVFIEAAQTTTASNNSLRFKLRIDDNLNPIIYVENKAVRDVKKPTNHIKKNEILSGPATAPATDWSRELKFIFPNTGTGGSKHNVAFYIKIYYFRQEHNPASPNTVLTNLKYYDSAFCSVDLRNLGEPTVVNTHLVSTDPHFVREPLRIIDGTGNFGYTAFNGVYWDGERILFYSTLKVKATASEKFYINAYTRKINIQNSKFTESSLRQSIDVLCREYGTANGNIRIPGINSYRTGNNNILNEKENVLLLGLTIPEITAIKSATGLSDKHQRYIFLSPEPGSPNPITDNNGRRYHRYTVQLQGLNGNGTPSTITPQMDGNPLLVHSRDNSFFTSANFSATETVSTGLNRVEFHIYHDGCVKINDNIDLSLVRKITDAANPADLSLVQKMFYFFHDAAGVTHEISHDATSVNHENCGLDILQINRMGTGERVFAIPPGHNIPPIDYTPFNANGVDAKTSYIYPDTGNVITEGNKTVNKVVISDFKMLYRSLGKKTFLVHLEAINVTALNIDFSFDASTRRFYCRPEVVAALIGALADFSAFVDTPPTQINLSILSTGSGYEDGSSFPSYEHNNGEAIDTLYHKSVAGLTQSQRVDRDQSFINAMHKFGFKKRMKGELAYHDLLTNATKDTTGVHDSHLHCGDLQLTNCALNE